MTYTVRELRAEGKSTDLGLRMREWRRSHPGPRGRWMRIEELAAMLGLNKHTVQRIEIGRTRPKPATIERIESFLRRWEGH